MIILIVSLCCLLVAALLLGWRQNRITQRKIASGEMAEEPTPNPIDMECCGAHEVCERDRLLAAVSREIIYYDDEELDAYRGTPADGYDEEGITAFCDVFYTMKEADVAGWIRSLQLRGIELPDALKDEVILIVGERRMRK